jgi:hypothetical protein
MRRASSKSHGAAGSVILNGMDETTRKRWFTGNTLAARKYRRREPVYVAFWVFAYASSAIYGCFSWWPLIVAGIAGLAVTGLRIQTYLEGAAVQRRWLNTLREQRRLRADFTTKCGRRPPRHTFLIPPTDGHRAESELGR